MSVTLSLFGAIHFNRKGVVLEDLGETVADADALFVEYPTPDPTSLGYWWKIAKVPAAFLGVVVAALLVQLPAFALFNRDLRSTELIAAQKVADGRPLHAVDRHPLLVMADMGFVWTLANWLTLWVLLTRWPTATVVIATAGTASAFGPALLQGRIGKPRLAALPALGLGAGWIWLVVAGHLPFAPFLVAYLAFIVCVTVTLDERNRVMLGEIADVAAAEGYEHVCLATGYKHLPGIATMAPNHGLALGTIFRSRWLRPGAIIEQKDVLGRPIQGSFGHPSPDLESAGGVLGKRAVATLIDWVVVAVLAVLVATAAYLLGDGHLPVATLDRVVVGAALLPIVSYHPAVETLYGRSLGKRAVGLVVAGADGDPVTRRQALLRTVLRPVDFLPAYYVLGAVLVALTGRGRRLGDLVAGTTVAPVETDWQPVAADAAREDAELDTGEPGTDEPGSGDGDTTDEAADGDREDADEEDGRSDPAKPEPADGDEPAPA